MPPTNVVVTRMYDYQEPREPHDFSLVALENLGKSSASPRLKVSETLPAAVEDSHRCDKPQPRNDVIPDGESSKSEPRSPIAASTRSQHFATSASSQPLRMAGGEQSGSAPIADDTKELGSYLVEAATAYVSQNRDDNTSVKASYGVQINDHYQAEGSEKVSGGHAMDWRGQARSSPPPGTSISTILSTAPSIPNNNKDNGSATSTGKYSGKALPRTLAQVEVSNNRDTGIAGAPLGELASAREQLQLLLYGQERG